MKQGNATSGGATAGEAARRFVRVDAGARGADAELAAWLAGPPENERSLERVELGVALGRRLAADPGSALYAEAAQAARLAPRRRARGRAFVWGAALVASLVAVFFVVRDGTLPASSPEIVTLEAARIVTFDAPSSSVAVLPGGAVVDASAVAVLPFAAAGDGALARGLERDVVDTLRTVPGLYVIADAAVSSYAATDLSPSEIGAQLGARGIVDAGVELVDGRVRVNVRLSDAATGATLWRTDLDRPVDELRAVRYEIADRVAGTMLDSGLREQAARAGRSSAPVSPSKPLPQ
jgi:TolB-like protein